MTNTNTDLTVDDVAAHGNAMLDELEKAVVGKREVLTQLLTGVFASGHVLFEDVPGLAKTLIARSVAQVAETAANWYYIATATILLTKSDGRF